MRLTCRLLWIGAVLALGLVLGMRPAAAASPPAQGLFDRAQDAGHDDVQRPAGGAAGVRVPRRDLGWCQVTLPAQTLLTGAGGSDTPPALPAPSATWPLLAGDGSFAARPADAAVASTCPQGPGCRGPPARV